MVIFGCRSSGTIHHVFMRQCLPGSWNPQVRLGWLASKPWGSLCLFLSAGITSISYCAWPFSGVRRPNFRPHAAIVDTSLMQPFPCPCSWLLEACGSCMRRTRTASWEPTWCVADREFLQEFWSSQRVPVYLLYGSRELSHRDKPCLYLRFLSQPEEGIMSSLCSPAVPETQPHWAELCTSVIWGAAT